MQLTSQFQIMQTNDISRLEWYLLAPMSCCRILPGISVYCISSSSRLKYSIYQFPFPSVTHNVRKRFVRHRQSRVGEILSLYSEARMFPCPVRMLIGTLAMFLFSLRICSPHSLVFFRVNKSLCLPCSSIVRCDGLLSIS